MMPTATTNSASAPLSYSSLPTCGPTKSTFFSVTSGVCALSVVITCSLICAALADWLTGSRISTSFEVPKFCTEISLRPVASSEARILSSCAGWL